MIKEEEMMIEETIRVEDTMIETMITRITETTETTEIEITETVVKTTTIDKKEVVKDIKKRTLKMITKWTSNHRPEATNKEVIIREMIDHQERWNQWKTKKWVNF